MEVRVTKRDIDRMETTVRHAQCMTEKVGGARSSAIIVLKNRIISFGHNQYKTHPLQAAYGKNRHAIYLHAEIDAIRNALRFVGVDELKKAVMYIARVKKPHHDPHGDDVWGLAHPCPGCLGAINAFGLRRVYYTTDETGTMGLLS